MKKHLCDLYRWYGKIDFMTFIKMMLLPKYRIVFLKRQCEYAKEEKHHIRYFLFRLWFQHVSDKYGVDFGARTIIGKGFILRHVGAIAIHADAILGDNIEILQGVTIGYERRGKRQGAPVLGNNIWIGSNATIVGKIRIGNNVLIAPNAFINFDVPDNSIVIGNPGVIHASSNAIDQYVLFTDY